MPVQEKVKEHEQNAARVSTRDMLQLPYTWSGLLTFGGPCLMQLLQEKESAEKMKTGMPIAELEAVDQ